jgi:succinate dehydrogenase / fumarate reductase cytochrome b subunit
MMPVRSSLASKFVMAVTGLLLMLFVLAHLIGNLLIFAGPDAINTYAQHLKALPPLLWTFRLGLLTIFVIHILMGIRLSVANSLARPVGYQYEDTRVASLASRTMLLTGVVILLFVLYHLAHFTLGWTHEAVRSGRSVNYLDLKQLYDPLTGTGVAEGTTHTAGGVRPDLRPDVYTMMIVGFRSPLIAGLYLLAQVALWFHLWHGASSWCQSIGLGPVHENRLIAWGGPAFATLILAGNSAIVLSVLLRFIGAGVPE